MGQRTATETLFGIVAAFVARPTWTQAELAKELDTTTETIRKRLTELQAAGFRLERQEDHPHVYWSVPKNWFPGLLPFKADEVTDLLRLLGRVPTSALRDRILGIVASRLSNLASAVSGSELGQDRPLRHPDDEERWLGVVEDALSKKTPLRMKYYSASRRSISDRTTSVVVIDHGPRPQFIALCHRTNALRRFRVSNVSNAFLDTSGEHRAVEPDVLARFRAESFGGFRYEGPVVRCEFFVREPECEWVAKNLPDSRIAEADAAGGRRFTIETTAVQVLARFVVGLGAAARATTPELAEQVATLARGALAAEADV